MLDFLFSMRLEYSHLVSSCSGSKNQHGSTRNTIRQESECLVCITRARQYSLLLSHGNHCSRCTQVIPVVVVVLLFPLNQGLSILDLGIPQDQPEESDSSLQKTNLHQNTDFVRFTKTWCAVRGFQCAVAPCERRSYFVGGHPILNRKDLFLSMFCLTSSHLQVHQTTFQPKLF